MKFDFDKVHLSVYVQIVNKIILQRVAIRS
jgi:hypothetical protein